MKEAHSYTCEEGRWYTFRYLVKDRVISVNIDGLPHETYTWIDESPLTEGYLGFRSYMSHLEFKDLVVYQVD